MNNQPDSELPDNSQADEMLPEYNFDYRKARQNRFASRATVTVTLDPDIAEVLTTSESVNNALRAIISAIPKIVNYNNSSS